MVKVIEVVKSGRMGVNLAAREYGILKTTLKDRQFRKVQHGRKLGPKLYLSSYEEKELVTFLIDVYKMGQGKTKTEVLDNVRNKIQMERKKGGRSIEQCECNGKGWWVRFKHRHPDLTLRTSDTLLYSRSNAVDKESITYYFNLLKKTFDYNNLMNKAHTTWMKQGCLWIISSQSRLH